MRYGNFTDRENLLIERVAQELELKFLDQGNDVKLRMKSSGTEVIIHDLGIIYEIRIQGRLYRVCPNLISVAITLCGYTEKASPTLQGWIIAKYEWR